jgi:hypothetical protein
MELKTQIEIPDITNSEMESYHEKYRISILAGLWLNFFGLATETVNIHERVNNAQAPAHQMQSAAAPVGIGDCSSYGRYGPA